MEKANWVVKLWAGADDSNVRILGGIRHCVYIARWSLKLKNSIEHRKLVKFWRVFESNELQCNECTTFSLIVNFFMFMRLLFTNTFDITASEEESSKRRSFLQKNWFFVHIHEKGFFIFSNFFLKIIFNWIEFLPFRAPFKMELKKLMLLSIAVMYMKRYSNYATFCIIPVFTTRSISLCVCSYASANPSKSN